ncbi:MAG: hypothetical protein GF317_14570 [Candidatus Lokiarchaeota archaeon]|nr:hypothetical protein [Candidatus Lokiarchaeota archaeon]MBD3200831.1 hypothetical protein [Candidatus Lokiarchaeota archaeon]
MSEKKEKKKKARGFAGVIQKQLNPLNDNEEFNQKFKDKDEKILLNARDGRYAALIHINNGKIDVEGIKNKKKENLKQDVLGWEGKLDTTTEIFFDLATGNLSTLSMLGKLITRKIKIKGMKKVMMLTELFSLL